MAIPRKGSRRITVGAHSLRWLVRRRQDVFRLLVERETDPGQRLVGEIPLVLFPADAQVLSPELAKQCVLLAMADGYSPDSRGGEYRFVVAAGQLDFALVDRSELKKRPVGRPRKRAIGEKRRPVYVSLDPPDRARLVELAAERGVGLGTLVREWILERLKTEESSR